jgi:CheY-like chemotaxis protein
MARLLLVDDDPDQVAIRKLVLESAGHNVWTAPKPAEALRLFPECEPEVILMDLLLPRTDDGLALIRDLRAISASVPILVLSGWAFDLSALPEGAMVNHFLRKPVRSQQLLSLIDKLGHGP